MNLISFIWKLPLTLDVLNLLRMRDSCRHNNSFRLHRLVLSSWRIANEILLYP